MTEKKLTKTTKEETKEVEAPKRASDGIGVADLPDYDDERMWRIAYQADQRDKAARELRKQENSEKNS